MNNQFRYSFLFLLLTVMVGSLGYRWLADSGWIDALYMTVITISTVGYGEVVDLQPYPAARVFTIFLIMVGMGNVIFFISLTTSYFTDGKVKQYLKARSNMSKVKQFNRHYILCGVGRIGRHILEQLVKHGKEVVVIERDVELLAELEVYMESSNKADKNHKLVFMEGDAYDDDLLMKSGLIKAQAVFCCLVSDQDNLLLTVTVKNLNSECLVYTRLKDMKNEKKFLNVGADYVVSPQYIGGVILANQAVRPTTIDFFSKMLKKDEHQIEEVTIPKGSWIVGKTLIEVDFQTNVKVHPIAVKSGEDISYSPSPEHYLLAGDILIFVIVAENRAEITKFISAENKV